MWRLALVLAVVGCTDHGKSPGPRPVDTPAFQPLICTSGTPGSVECPVNTAVFDEVGVGVRATFTMQFLGSGAYMNGVRFVAGPDGLHADVSLLVFPHGVATPTVHPLGRIDLEPDQASEPITSATVGDLEKLAFRFED